MRARLLVLGFSLSWATVACSTSPAASPAPNDAGDAGADGPVDTAPASWNRPVTPPSDQTAQEQRSSCGYVAGALPLETQGASEPDGSTIPIDTIVIVMMENRSFDHYFMDLKNNGWTDVDVADASTTNPGIDGNPVALHQDTSLCFADTNHGWVGTHSEIDNGKMDGFAIANDGTHEQTFQAPPDFLSGARAMTYYKAADLPLMYWAAQNFSISDRYFASLPGPTWPNRLFLYAASSYGLTTDTFPSNVTKTLFDYLELRGVPWSIYADGTPGFALVINELLTYRSHVKTFAQFATDASAGKLPSVVFVDPGLGQESYKDNDEHPPAVMQVGQAWLAQVISTLIASPHWAHAAMFLNYDEHGGLYDHVVPPPACPPDAIPPDNDGGTFNGFSEYGVRLPFVVLSPYAKQHYVSHLVYDHTSVVRFVEARFRIPALTNRDANALAPWDMFDFTSPPHPSPPAPPPVPIDDAILQSCATLFADVPTAYSE